MPHTHAAWGKVAYGAAILKKKDKGRMGRFTLATLLACQPVAAMAHQHAATLRQGKPALAIGAALDGSGRAWLAKQWIRLGSYWVDAANAGKYDGPALVDFNASGSAPTYTAGLRCSPVLGLQAKW